MRLIKVLTDNLANLEDPRVIGRTKHSLVDVVALSVIAVMSHAESFVEIEEFGNYKYKWLKKILKLSNGIPSHDTIARVFCLLDHKQLERIFMEWVESMRKDLDGPDVISIDGKTIRGTGSMRSGHQQNYLHLLNIWSTRMGLVLGQLKCEKGHGERKTTIDALQLINVKGTTILTDAGIGSNYVASEIINKGGNYIFPVKKNTRPLYFEIEKFFKQIDKGVIKKSSKASVKESSRGRKETRNCVLVNIKKLPKNINAHSFRDEYFPNLAMIGKIVYTSTRAQIGAYQFKTVGDKKNNLIKRIRTTSPIKVETSTRYFVTNLHLNAKKLLNRVRDHWAIENKLHWVLDVNYGEDASRVRNKNIASNLAIIRKIAFNLAKQDTSLKKSIKCRLKIAAWDESYLERILFKKNIP